MDEDARDLRKAETAPEARSEAASALARKRNAAQAPRARRRQASQAAKAFWDSLSPEQRRAEMRRRRKLGFVRKKQALLSGSEIVKGKS